MGASFAVKAIKRRYFLLIEVMIALTLIIFAVLPLIYPHFYIYKEQKSFVNKLNLDLAVNHFYAHIIEQLQRNEISFQDIEQGTKMALDLNGIEGLAANLPYIGHYHFAIVKSKKSARFGLYEVQLHIQILPKEKSDNKKALNYEYLIFVGRLFQTESGSEKNDEENAIPTEQPLEKKGNSP